MAAPTIAAAAANPIEIDPLVAYPYVVPVNGETELGFEARALFDLAVSGRRLTVKYTGPLLAVATVYPITVFASNAHGTVTQTINFRVAAYVARAASPVFSVATAASSANIAFPAGKPVADNLIIGWQVKFDQGTTGTLSNTTRFVVAIDSGANTFQVSATFGGSPITIPSGENDTYNMTVATAIGGNPNVFVGDATPFTIGDPVQLVYSDSAAFPPALAGLKYVQGKLGNYISLSATSGGSGINSDVTSFIVSGATIIAQHNARSFPAITTADGAVSAWSDSVAIAIASDIAADAYFASGLPDGLSTDSSGAISGTPTESGTFYLLFRAIKGAHTSFRYYILTISAPAAAAGDTIGEPDLAFDLLSREVYPLASVNTRGGLIPVVFKDSPLVIAIVRDAADAELAAGSEVRLLVNAPGTFTSGAPVMQAAGSLAGRSALVTCAEDWSTAALDPAAQRYKDFIGQLGYRPGSAGKWRNSKPFTFRVYANAAGT